MSEIFQKIRFFVSGREKLKIEKHTVQNEDFRCDLVRGSDSDGKITL